MKIGLPISIHIQMEDKRPHNVFIHLCGEQFAYVVAWLLFLAFYLVILHAATTPTTLRLPMFRGEIVSI